MSDDSDNKFTDEFKEELWQEFLATKEDGYIEKTARELFYPKVFSLISEFRLLQFKNFVLSLEIYEKKHLVENFIEELSKCGVESNEFIEQAKARLIEIEAKEKPDFHFNVLELSPNSILKGIDDLNFYSLNEFVEEDLSAEFTDFLKSKNITSDEDIDEMSFVAIGALFDEEEKLKTPEHIEKLKASINDFYAVYKSLFLNIYRIKESDITLADFEFFLLIDSGLMDIRGEQLGITNKDSELLGVSELIGYYTLFSIQKRNKIFFKIYNKVISNYLNEERNEKSWLYSESIFYPKSQFGQFLCRLYDVFLNFYYDSGDYVKKVSDYKKDPSLSMIDSDTLREIMKKLNIPRNTEAGRPKKAKE